jgi:DNA-binding MarR family transcriptional regulator
MSKNTELRQLAERLIQLSGSEGLEGALVDRHDTQSADPDDYDEAVLVQVARSFYRIRRTRSRILPADLFAEPAWDMLLDLFIQRSNGQRVTVTSLCIASGVPPTTALRWISGLIESDLVARFESEQDRRKAFIVLTDRGYREMRSILIEAIRYFQPRHEPFMLKSRIK